MNWRFGEVMFAHADGRPLDVQPGDFKLSAWQVTFPWDKHRATLLTTSSPMLDRVWYFMQNSVQTLTLDLYTDSNARQRSPDCQADAAVAAQVADTLLRPPTPHSHPTLSPPQTSVCGI